MCNDFEMVSVSSEDFNYTAIVVQTLKLHFRFIGLGMMIPCRAASRRGLPCEVYTHSALFSSLSFAQTRMSHCGRDTSQSDQFMAAHWLASSHKLS
jgi:hypothetical protein